MSDQIQHSTPQSIIVTIYRLEKQRKKNKELSLKKKRYVSHSVLLNDRIEHSASQSMMVTIYRLEKQRKKNSDPSLKKKKVMFPVK